MSASVRLIGTVAIVIASCWSANVEAAPDPPDETPPVAEQETSQTYAEVFGIDPSLVVEASSSGRDGSGNSSDGGSGDDSSTVNVAGEGNGESFTCTGTPVVDQSQVDALAVAWSAGDTSGPANPVIGNVLSGTGINAPGVGLPWFGVFGGVPHVVHDLDCGPVGQYRDWVAVALVGGTFVPQPQPEDLVPELFERVVRQLPTPVPRIAPADWQPEQWAFVNVSTFFWVEQARGQWSPVVAEASVPGLTVTAQAVPERMVVHPGDGGDDVVCNGPPPPFRQNRDNPLTFRGCEYTYLDSSAMADNGESFPLTVDVVWHATWSASNGESGDLGYVSTTSEVRWLPVAEIQSIVTDG